MAPTVDDQRSASLVIPVDDIDVFCPDQGSGDPVVLVHNLEADHTIFDGVARALAQDYRVVRYDLRGHGRTNRGNRAPSLQTLANDLGSLLTELGIGHAHLVGQSIGGMVLFEFVVTSNAVAGTVAIFSSVAWTDAAWDQRYATRAELVELEGMASVASDVALRSLGVTTLRESPELQSYYRDQLLRAQQDGYAWACRAMRNFDFRPVLSHLAWPTMIAAGDEDVITTVDHARGVASMIPGAVSRHVPASGHVPSLEQPIAMVQVLRSWFLANPM